MNNKKLSKKLSHALRHAPENYNLELDKNGYTNVASVLDAFNVTIDELVKVIEENDKQRFSFSPDGSKVRANQGHSIKVDLELKSVKPPITLYHGTATKNLDSILEKGLIKGSRQHVHLSDNTKTAAEVGKRYGTPYIIHIEAALMYFDGYKFYLSDNGVWLTDHVPSKYIIWK